MKKTFESYGQGSRNRNYLSAIACNLYRDHLKIKDNWILIDDFAYATKDEDEEQINNICGYVFKIPLILNGVSYSMVMASYYTTPQEQKEALDSYKEYTFDDIDIEDSSSCYLTEWVLGKKKLPSLTGGNI